MAAKKNEISREEIYESFLQLYLFAGFPAALEAMRALQTAWPAEGNVTVREPVSYPDFLDRGNKLFERIYGKNASRVRDGMMKLSPELGRWAMTDGYSKTLSRPGLDVKTRELAIVAVLTQSGWERQLGSHIFGALNAGAGEHEVREAIAIGAQENSTRFEASISLMDRLQKS